jgi:hypothetical protein
MRCSPLSASVAASLLAAGCLTLGQAQAAMAASASGGTTRLVAAPTQAPVPSFGHVFVIVGENKALFQLNSQNAPYIMNTLRPESAWMTDYYAITPGSLADYIALTSGQYAPCQAQGPCGSFAVPSIFSQLGDGLWMDWNESMPSNCYASRTGSESDLNAYKPGHNPALYYQGIPCSTYDVPAGTTGPDDMSQFNDALQAGTVPEYNFITPNLCEDSYHSCNGANIVTEYNDFLQREIPLIEQSPAFGSNGVIFVTYDEGYVPTRNENTMLAVLGPQVQPGSYSGYYDHYSTLATIEAGLGLGCLANACSASTLPVFGGGPSAPSVSITQPVAGSTVSGTVTVAGTATAQGSASISQVAVSVDGGTPQPATGTSSWSASIDTTALTNGAHTITVTSTDSNGLTGSASITVNVANAAATACPAPPAGAIELSGNVSVESGLTGWTGKYNANSVVSRVEPAGGSYDGLWAVQVGIKSGSGQGGVSNASPVWVNATAQGTTYTASSFVRASVAGEKVSLTLTEETAAGRRVGHQTASVTLAGTGWHQMTGSYTAQAAGDVLHYALHAYLAAPSDTFQADCLSLQAPAQAAGGLLAPR